MDLNAKLRPIYLLRILRDRTDEEHFLSTAQLCAILKAEYGMDTHRTTIKSDIEMLQNAGFGIQTIRSSQNLYNYIDREFDNAELKLLLDAVESSRFITKSKSERLAAKLTALAGRYKAQELKRNLLVDNRRKPANERVFYIADTINTAINRKKKIRFQKTEYNTRKEQVLRNGGEWYEFSPYSLVWDGDYYYVLGYSDKHGGIGSHRVDRIAEQPIILEADAVAPPPDFEINDHLNATFRMFHSPRRTVELLCDNSVINAVIDRFGIDADIAPVDGQTFRVAAEAAVSPMFFRWVFGFGGLVKLIGPDEVKSQYIALVKETYESLTD